MQLKRENKSLRRFCYDTKSWEEILSEAWGSCNEEKLGIDLLALLGQLPETFHLEVLKNLIEKMKSGSNHRYTDIIKDISAIHKNRLGQTNYSILQDLLGFCGKTIAVAHAFKDQLQLGINHNVIAKVSNVCYKEPVIECSDEARILQFLSPCNSGRVAKLVGECWDPDIDKWSKCRRIVPRKSVIFPDDFTALGNYISEVTTREKLVKSVAIHNFTSLAGMSYNPLINIVWSTPNRGYKSVHLLNIWDQIRYNCFFNSNYSPREEPVLLMRHSTDSATFQLASAAGSLMTPTREMVENEVIYLTLGIGESKYSAPYLGYLPSIALSRL